MSPAHPPLNEDANAVRARLRHIHRAASDLRRGVPVLLDGDEPLVLLAAETAGPDTMAELAALGVGEVFLLIAPIRASAVLRQPVDLSVDCVAIRLPPAVLQPVTVLGMIDPTAPQPDIVEPLTAEPAPTLGLAALNLAKIVRLLPAVLAVRARPDSAAEIARRGLIAVAARDLADYPVAEAAGLRQIAAAPVPLADAADAQVIAFRSDGAGLEHLAIVIGDPRKSDAALVRIHSECFTGDLLGSMRCDCGEQLRGAIRQMAENGSGIVLYLAQEGRGIGLVNKLRAYTLQDWGLDTLDANRVLGWGADERNFLVGAAMLGELGIKRVRLLTNNPDKLAGLAACGIEVVGREAHAFAANAVNEEYLATKAVRFGHMLD